MSDDYYDLLGIDADAPTEEIRTAYREKKDALNEKGDKSGVAQLNKAWNVLSDPYQRGRYDAERENGNNVSDALDGDDITVEDAPPPRRRRFLEPPDRSNQPARPVPVAPAGMTFPPPRRRIYAMVIDLFIVFGIFLGGLALSQAVLNANHKADVDRQKDLSDQITDARDEFNDLDDAADKAEDRHDNLVDANASQADIDEAEAAAREARAKADAQQREVDALQDQYDDVTAKLSPTSTAFTVGAFVLGLLYLVVPSAFGGQTLGKKIMRVRVVREDGSPINFWAAMFRYGIIAFPTFLAGATLLGPLAAAIALIVVLGWMRNAKLQGLHDRTAKTLVVEA
ncbi:MAG TPA: RDD family protein [Acidimicrobiia bacterium]|nr:RDD family protein [Acidimicrobiia bacterium]